MKKELVINKNKEKIEEDWDFDFSEYEEDSVFEEESVESIMSSKKNMPLVSGLRSRFSTGEQSLNLLVDIKRNITKFSIDVGSRQADISTLWKYYALLDEFWEHMRNIFGSVLNKEIKEIKNKCRILLEDCVENNKPPSKKVYNHLLYFRSCLYRIFQFSNLGIEVERRSKSQFHKTKRKVVE